MRKRLILDKIEKEGSILVKDIADSLGISETTVRRDLNELDSLGLLKQVYGGAVRTERRAAGLNVSISSRGAYEIEAKKKIGRLAASFVQDNDILYIDPGTTSWEMIPHLKDRTNLTIISNSVRLIQCLDCIGHHTIVQLGGALRTDRLDTVGSLAQIGIEQLRGYKAFQGGDGLDIDFGLSAVDHESALIAKIILGNAREVFVLADHTKFDHPSLLYKIVDIEKINCLITDRPLDTAWAQKCRQSDITVAVAKG